MLIYVLFQDLKYGVKVKLNLTQQQILSKIQILAFRDDVRSNLKQKNQRYEREKTIDGIQYSIFAMKNEQEQILMFLYNSQISIKQQIWNNITSLSAITMQNSNQNEDKLKFLIKDKLAQFVKENPIEQTSKKLEFLQTMTSERLLKEQEKVSQLGQMVDQIKAIEIQTDQQTITSQKVQNQAQNYNKATSATLIVVTIIIIPIVMLKLYQQIYNQYIYIMKQNRAQESSIYFRKNENTDFSNNQANKENSQNYSNRQNKSLKKHETKDLTKENLLNLKDLELQENKKVFNADQQTLQKLPVTNDKNEFRKFTKRQAVINKPKYHVLDKNQLKKDEAYFNHFEKQLALLKNKYFEAFSNEKVRGFMPIEHEQKFHEQIFIGIEDVPLYEPTEVYQDYDYYL